MEKVLEYRMDATEQLLSETIDFTPEDITNLLIEMGLLLDYQRCRIEELEKYIFLYGDEQEIYVTEERQFIESVDLVYIYNDMYRKTQKGTMSCRIIATELYVENDAIRDSLFLMKVINKAIDGFNIFLIRTKNEFFVGCRLFDIDENKNCVLSSPIISSDDLDEFVQKTTYLPVTEEFVPYYSTLVESLEYRDNYYQDYSSKIIRKRGIQFAYLEMLSEIERTYNVKMSREIERYYNSFEECRTEAYSVILADTLDSLDFVKSFKANTIEMLFEAEEMVIIVNEAEAENERLLLITSGNKPSDATDDEKIKEHLDDPEMMIKLLKQRKGL